MATKQQPYFILKLIGWKLKVADFLNHFLLVGIRLWLANIFWTSGTLKLDSGFLGIGQGNWDSTLFLFENEYQVPYLNFEWAAYISTTAELLLSLLLVFGLGGRIAATGFLIMTAVIEYTYQSNPEHTVWALLLGVIALQGPGLFSLDYIISRKFLPNRYK